MDRRELSISGTTATLAFFGEATADQAASAVSARPVMGQAGVCPHVADTSNASSMATTFFRRSFTAKTLRDFDVFMEGFHPCPVSYCAETLDGCGGFAARTGLKQRLVPFTAACESDAKSYPLRILGNANVDTPEMFGAEICMISAIDSKDGKFTRNVGSWDGPRNPGTGFRSPADPYPYSPSGEHARQDASPSTAMAAPALVVKHTGFGGAERLLVVK